MSAFTMPVVPRLPDAAYSVTAQRMYAAFASYSGSAVVWEDLGAEVQAAWITAAKVI